MRMIALPLAMLMLACSPYAAACKPVAGHNFKVPTDSERIERADVLFTGRVVSSTAAPELDVHPMGHPYNYIYVLEVDSWEKGGTGNRVEVLDNAGTNCDHLYQLTHLVPLAQSAHPGAKWRVFARESKGRLWVTTAVFVK